VQTVAQIILLFFRYNITLMGIGSSEQDKHQQPPRNKQCHNGSVAKRPFLKEKEKLH